MSKVNYEVITAYVTLVPKYTFPRYKQGDSIPFEKKVHDKVEGAPPKNVMLSSGVFVIDGKPYQASGFITEQSVLHPDGRVVYGVNFTINPIMP